MLRKFPDAPKAVRRLLESRVGRAEFIRYFLASGIALVIDFTLLIVLTELAGFHYLVSAAVGFTVGAVSLYMLSITVVFRARRLEDASAELTLFFAIGILGLAATQFLMAMLVSLGGLAYPIAKFFTVGSVFFLNFSARKLLLFHVLQEHPGQLR